MSHLFSAQHRLPLVTAHSGCEGTPANSLRYLRAALDAGAEVAEVDVRLSGAGRPILMHDEPPVGVELPGTVVSLESALIFIASERIALNLDLKDNACVEPVGQLVRSIGLTGRVIVSGCGPARAHLMREFAPEIPVLLNVDPPLAGVLDLDTNDYATEICRVALEHHCSGLNLDYRVCRPALVDLARRRYLPVSVWTVDDDSGLREMIAMGVHSITTNYPRRLVELLKDCG